MDKSLLAIRVYFQRVMRMWRARVGGGAVRVAAVVFLIASLVLAHSIPAAVGEYAVAASAAPAPAPLRVPTIRTIAGGPGGPSPLGQIAQASVGVAVRGSTLFVGDTWFTVLRAVDLVSGVERVVAGDGTPGYAGDGGPAVSAQLSGVYGIATDATGGVYFSDTSVLASWATAMWSQGNHVVRRIGTDGTIRTVAGTGIEGDSGDGGPATAAQFLAPAGLAIDGTGNVFISDPLAHRVRRVSTAGTITTVAGTGVDGDSGDTGLATAAQLRAPIGLAFDTAGNLLIADTVANRVRQVSPAGIITTVAGTGTEGTTGDGGPATSADLNRPIGLASDGQSLLISGGGFDAMLRRVDSTGVISSISTVPTPDTFGGATQIDSLVVEPSGRIWLTGYVMTSVQDTVAGAAALMRIDPGGNLVVVTSVDSPLYLPLGGNALAAQIGPRVLAADASGRVYFPAGGGILAVDPDGTLLKIADNVEVSALAVDTEGTVYGTQAVGANPFGYPGTAFVIRINRDGTHTTIAGGGPDAGDGIPALSAKLGSLSGITVDKTGNVYISDYDTNRIRRISPDGTITTIAGGGAASSSVDGTSGPDASLGQIPALAIAPDGSVVFLERGSSSTVPGPAVRRVDRQGLLQTVSTVSINSDTEVVDGLAVDIAGNAFVSVSGTFQNSRDRCVCRIIEIRVGGDPRVVVNGAGGGGFSGDGGPAIDAHLYVPAGLATSAHGELFIADTFNRRIRSVEGLVATSAIVPIVVTPTFTG